MSKEFQTYRQSDLGLAAFLVASGCQIKELDRTNPRRVDFVFERTPQLESLAEKYWSNQSVHLVPQYYWLAIKSLKARVHSG